MGDLINRIKGITEGFVKGLGAHIEGFLKKRLFGARAKKRPKKKKADKFVFITRDTWWRMGSSDKKPGMYVSCKCHVTNVEKKLDIKPVRVVLKRSETDGAVTVDKVDGDVWDEFVAPDRYMASLDIDFHVTEPFEEKGKSFRSDIIVYDQFNGPHVIRNVEFKYR